MPNKLEWQKTLRGADDLSDAEFRVVMILSTYADAQLGNARPGGARLIADSCLTEKSVKRALAGLLKKGYLELVEQGGNQYGKGRANVYRLLPQSSTRGVLGTPLQVTEVTLDETEGGYFEPGKGGTSSPGRGVPSTPPSSHSSSHPSRTRARSGGPCQVCGLHERFCRKQNSNSSIEFGHDYQPHAARAEGWLA